MLFQSSVGSQHLVIISLAACQRSTCKPEADTCGPEAEHLHLQAVGDMSRFGRIVKLMTFKAFQSAADALEQCNAVAEGSMTEDLRHFLEMTLPKVPTDVDRMGLLCRAHRQKLPS